MKTFKNSERCFLFHCRLALNSLHSAYFCIVEMQTLFSLLFVFPINNIRVSKIGVENNGSIFNGKKIQIYLKAHILQKNSERRISNERE